MLKMWQVFLIGFLKIWKVYNFCGWRFKWDRYRPFWPRLPGPGCQRQEPVSHVFLVVFFHLSEFFYPLLGRAGFRGMCW